MLQSKPTWLIPRMGLRRQLFWSVSFVVVIVVVGHYIVEGKRRGQKFPKQLQTLTKIAQD